MQLRTPGSSSTSMCTTGWVTNPVLPPPLAFGNEAHGANFGCSSQTSARRRSVYGRMPPARKTARSNGVSIRATVSNTQWSVSTVIGRGKAPSRRGRPRLADERPHVRSGPATRPMRPARTPAAAPPCRRDSNGGSARTTPRSPRARRAGVIPSRPSRASCPIRTPCPPIRPAGRLPRRSASRRRRSSSARRPGGGR